MHAHPRPGEVSARASEWLTSASRTGVMLPEMTNLLDCAPLLGADEPSNDVSKWLADMDLQI